MHLKKLFKGLKYKFSKKNDHLEKKLLCGKVVKTIKGTIRNHTDMDDAWFFQLAKNEQVIFDIGSNVGYTALLALLQNPLRRYVLVDANPLALANAGKNLMMNLLGANASYFTSFVSDTNDKEIKFYTIGTGAAGSMFKSHAKTAALMNEYSKVSTVTLDYLWKFYQINPDLIKIDVEGAESLVLNGAKDLAKNVKPIFFVEMHATEEIPMIMNAQKVLDWCLELKYVPWYMKDATVLKTAEDIADRGRCHLLLVSESKEYPQYLTKIKQGEQLPLITP